MAKVAGSYESVIGGVSEQVPQDRRPGQHYAQVNMVSDPVRGLARRHGSIMQDEKIVASYTEDDYAKWTADTKTHKEFTFSVAGTEYSLIYRSAADVQVLGQASFAFAFNKSTQQFVPVSYATSDTVLNQLVSGGVSAITSVGRYVYLAGNSITPTWTPTDAWGDTTNKKKLVCWVRSGAYSRTFSVTVTRADGSKVTGSYKTKASSYPGVLDTSLILTGDPDYVKKINDATNAYNTAVTQWIGTAAEDITPQNIAAALRGALTIAGVSAGSISHTDSTIIISDTQGFIEITADDGGDGSLIRAVGNEVTAAELVSTIHWPNKVVRVRPKLANEDDAYYLKAVPVDPTATTFTKVSWQETAGYIMTPQSVFIMGTIVGGTLYLASTKAGLDALTGITNPAFKGNSVGDDLTSPLPSFFGKRIDYLGMFQDRLTIGSGSVLFYSKPGDYFNWWRGSVLTVADDDPIELFSLGAEEDTIRYSTTFDRNIVYFGDEKQYVVSGRTKFSPGPTASIVAMSAHPGTTVAQPKNTGNLVFYSKATDGFSSLHQIQTGLLADSPETFDVSAQLDKFLVGSPVQIEVNSSPNVIILRTDGPRNTVYTYTYLDNAAGSERLFDAWNQWTWSEHVGDIIGVSKDGGHVLVFLLKHGTDKDGVAKIWVSCERFLLDSKLASVPYLDSLRPASEVTGTVVASAYINPVSGFDDVSVAFDVTTDKFLLGGPVADLDELLTEYPEEAGTLWAGIDFPAYVTPTNPYIRDRNGKAVVNGRLTLGKLNITVADTGGLIVTVSSSKGDHVTKDFNGRTVGSITNVIGKQPVVSTSVSALIGKEVRECTYSILAKGWLPLTVTAIEYIGQSFNNARRI